jgi:hypothetical protein
MITNSAIVDSIRAWTIRVLPAKPMIAVFTLANRWIDPDRERRQGRKAPSVTGK